jgi:hypothetical protein
MHRGRLVTAFAAASAVLMLASVLLSAVLENRLDTVFGGILKPILANEKVAVMGDVRLYSRDIEMLRLCVQLRKVASSGTSGDELSDDDALRELIDQTLLAEYAADNGMTYDSTALDEALAPLHAALETAEGQSLRSDYMEKFARKEKDFEADLTAAIRRELIVGIFLKSLYYTAAAEGIVSPGFSEAEALEMLRDKLLIKLRVETDIKIY